ncbi:unnamed protein product [Durusdinium trenchii]|uniref:Uncharacterized protein n=1 Tax=Durusdinium trenchii TaxID=1381693 RepID=A0ABP0M604_9DINO
MLPLQRPQQQTKGCWLEPVPGTRRGTFPGRLQACPQEETRMRADGTGLHRDEMEVIREQMRIYVGHGSFWVIIVSPRELNSDGIKSVLEDFVNQRRSTSLGWTGAEVPQQVSDFAAPGFQKVVDLVEGLREQIQVPNLVLLRGSFFKGLARQLIQRNGEEAAEWQVRVVNNYRDLEDHDWLNPHCNVDLHFVQSPHWPTLPWKKPELLERLKTFADRRPQSQVLHAVAFLIHAIQKDPEWLGMSLDSMMQNCKVLSDTAAEPSEILRKVVKACGAAAQTGAEVDEEGRSALHRAAFNGEIDEVERLLRAGLDIEAKDNRVDTPLHLAAGYGHLTVVDRLIAAGAVLEATGRFGATPLHWAAVAGHWEVAQRLIEARADLEAKDHSGRTPLHRAAEECYWEVAQRLIEARADLKVRDKQGQTPWHFAKKNGWKKMIGVLHPVQVGKLRSGRTVPCDLKDRRTVHGLQEDFQWRATELLKKKTEELYVLIPKMVDLFEGIDDTKMERLAEQLVEMMEVSTDVLLTKSMKHYGQLRLQCIKLQGDAFVDSLAWLQEEFHFLMTSFENCLQGQKIRVSDDEFRDMMDLVHLDQLLAQVKKHQERRQVVEDELESSAEDAYSEVDEVSDIEKNEQGAGVPQVICLAMLAIGL